MQSNPFRGAYERQFQKKEPPKPAWLQRALDERAKKKGADPVKSRMDALKGVDGTVSHSLAQLERKFGKRTDWAAIRPVLSKYLYTRQYGLDEKGRIDISKRITGLEEPQFGETQDQFWARVASTHRVTKADLDFVERAVREGDLSPLVEGHAQFQQSVASTKQLREQERQAKAWASLPFTPEDYQAGTQVGSFQSSKDGKVYDAGDAGRMIQRAGLPVPKSLSVSEEEARQEAGAANRLLTEGQFGKERLPEGQFQKVQDEKPGKGGSLKPDIVTETVANLIADPLINAGTLIDPSKSAEEKAAAAAWLALDIGGIGLIAKGARGAKALLSTEKYWDDFAASLKKLEVPDHIKVVEQMRGRLDDPQFYSYMEALAKKPDAFVGKGGLDDAAEFAAKQVEPPKAPKADAPKSTSLANQQQEREAIAGVIKKIDPASGRSPDYWMEEGKKAFTSIPNARALAADIAQGKVMSPTDVGHLLEGKRQMLQEIEDIGRRLDKDPGNKDLIRALEDAEDNLQGYLDDIQTGKGQASDVFRALQAGSTLDEGNFADVLQKMKRGGHATEGDIKKAREASEKVSGLDKDAQAARSRAADNANEQIKVARTTKTDPEALAKEREALLAEAKKNGVSDDLLKRMGLNKARSGEGTIDEIVGQVRDDLKSLDMDADPQRVIDSIAVPDPPKNVTEAGLRAKELRKSARARSTEKFTKDVIQEAIDELDEQIKTANLDDRFRLRQEQQALKEAQQAINNAIKEAERFGKGLSKETEATVKALRKQAQDAFDRIQRAKTKAERDEYTFLWKSKLKEADDAQKVLDKEIMSGIRAGLRGGDAAAKDVQRTLDELRKQQQKAWEKLQNVRSNEAKQSYKRWWDLQAQIQDLEEQVVTGKFKPPKERAPSEFEDLQAMRDLWAGRVRSGVEASKVPAFQRAIENVAGNVRGLSLGADIGVVFRQGLFTTSRPKAFVRALGQAGKVAFSEKNLAKYQRSLDNARTPDGKMLQPIRRKAGLSLTDTFNNREELAAARMLQKIPGIGKAVGGSLERFQTAFINTARAEVFDAAVRRGYSPNELKLRAQFINNATGRGNFKRSPDTLFQILMTSPRYEKSRWAMLGEPIKNAALIRAGSKAGMATGQMGFNRAAIANLQDMVVTASEVFGMFKLAEAAEYKVNMDPISSDFLKMREGEYGEDGTWIPGEEVWDVTAGISPRMRDLMRLYVMGRNQVDKEGEEALRYGKNWLNLLGSAVGRTASPAIRTPLEKGSMLDQKYDLEKQGWKFIGTGPNMIIVPPVTETGREPKNPFSGFAFDDDEMDWPSLFPLVIQATVQTTKAEGGWAGAGAFLKEFLGTSVNRYPARGTTNKAGQDKSSEPQLTKEQRMEILRKKQRQ